MPTRRRGAGRAHHEPGEPRPVPSAPASTPAAQAPDGGDRDLPGEAAGTLTDAASGDLRRSAIDGVKWNFVATVASLVGRLAFTFVLARLIGPENFGIVSLATVYVLFAVVVLDQGFGIALIQRKELGPKDVGSVAWLNVATGAVLMVATLFAAPYAAEFFDTPELTGVLRVLSVTLLIRGFTLVRSSLVRRFLRFREYAIIQTVAVFAGGVAGIVAAAMGAEYWALVVQTLVNDVIILTALMVMFRATGWSASWASLRSMAGFSTKVLATNMLVYISSNADNILIGRVLNPTQLAFYALSYRLLRLPIQMVGSVVNEVALPIFAQLQDDDERSRSWFLVATRAVGFLTFPLFGLMVVGADAGVELAFGTEWAGAVAPLQAMAIAGIPMVVRMLLGPLANARGKAGLTLTWTVVGVTLQFIGFFVGLWLGGMVGVAVSIAIVQYLTWLPNVGHVVHATVAMPLRTYVATLLPPAVGTVLAMAAWWGVYRPFAPAGGQPHDVLGFALAALASVAVYAVAVRLLFPDAFRSFVGLARQMARRKAAV